MARTTRLRQTIIAILDESGPLATNQIQEIVNERLRHGTTSQQLGNVLAKDPRFVKVGMTTRAGFLSGGSCSGGYEVCVWNTTTHDENTPSSRHTSELGTQVEH
jgi:hypothetical protein